MVKCERMQSYYKLAWRNTTVFIVILINDITISFSVHIVDILNSLKITDQMHDSLQGEHEG